MILMNNIQELIENNKIKDKLKIKKQINILNKYSDKDIKYEIGVDEVGRGPLFGRVYASAVILPKDDNFDFSRMKDSKKFTSNKKIQEVSDYIKENAIAWSVQYEDENTIDNINILQASQLAMHNCINKIIQKYKYEIYNDTDDNANSVKLLIDGNYFKPFMIINPIKNILDSVNYECIEGGDNKYCSIAAASILAKVERDKYILELCEKYPYLVERYSLDTNKGYGSKKHREGIEKYGITEWHRKTFGICRNFNNYY